MKPIGSQIPKCAALLTMALLCFSGPLRALELTFAGSPVLVASSTTNGHYLMATGPFLNGAVPTRLADGFIQDLTWQISGPGTSTASFQFAVSAQLANQDYDITYTCFASVCGGFDFRHALPLGTPPEMYVDLSDFVYMTAQREGEFGLEEIAVTISHGGLTGFVHLAVIQPLEAAQTPVVQSSRASDVVSLEVDELIAQLTATGSAALDDLRFETGASQLNNADTYLSLTALAGFLNEDSSRRIVLVGHTDALGSLSGNITRSQARASAVRRHLTQSLGVNPAQVQAQGIGYLSPRASNTTSAGRETNRRVEVVLATAP